MKRTPLRRKSKSEVSLLKDDIQAYVRDIVILRDKGCIFKKEKGHICSGYAKDGHLVLQADHLITRSNSETFADTRLVVCVCRGIHGWKSVGSNLRKAEYDERVKKLLSKETLDLWIRCEQNRFNSYRMGSYDWKLELANLKSELKELQNGTSR